MALLEVRGLHLAFGGVQALAGVDLEVHAGEFVALIGPNGAGKTSLFNCITGFYQPQAGSIRFRGRELVGLSPDAISRLGLARTFQNIELFRMMTGLQNLLLGRHSHVRAGLLDALLATPRWWRDEEAQRRRVEEILELLDLQVARAVPVGALPYGLQKLVELGRALAQEPSLLLLDEPSAGLTPEEKEEFLFKLQDVRDAFGPAILLVEHDLNLVMRASERVVVLDRGRVVASGPPAEIQRHPEVIQAYLGGGAGGPA
ncbi:MULTISPECIES: ABC transporter ATP-binding protein [Limnochorda]|uniref:ABC transporter ATP-binding protein n=1 Tax=Limnochorda TaxID=1676651 RepID=UPI0017F03A5F|nr:ABC transporter ATP-binding protein [Limnochorda pilosa]MBO2485571.1 ABC transporter ATP-binding protein [Bacillota bacterium]MBO2518630.1 ABC transporter ATP-binding protein [Bacillota bacterium]NMA71197.1 ABC transporter ATP-binding protein [Bacillota bacterium]